MPLLLGVALMTGAVAIDDRRERLQASDLRDIEALRSQLDSVQGRLAAATSPEDSARFAASISMRTSLLARREFHVPSRQDAIDRWWDWNGAGTWLAACGAGLLLLALVTYRRQKTSAHPA